MVVDKKNIGFEARLTQILSVSEAQLSKDNQPVPDSGNQLEPECVFLFDEPTIKRQAPNYRERLQHIFSNLKRPVFEIDAEALTERGLITAFSSLDTSSMINVGDTTKVAALSNYRILCNLIELHPQGVICIHSAHELSRDALHVLTRLSGYVRSRQLAWQFVLFAKIKKVSTLAIAQLNVDEFYPPQKALPAWQVSTVQPNLDFLSGYTKNRRFAGYATLGLLGMIGASLLMLQSEHKPMSLESQALESRPLQLQSSALGSSVQTTSELGQSVTGQERLRTSRIELDEFAEQFDADAMLSNDYVAEPSALIDESSVLVESKLSPELIDTLNVRQNVAAKQVLSAPNAQMSPELELAIRSSDLDSVKRLHADGESLNLVDSQGRSALVWAALWGEHAIADYLIANKAELDTADLEGRTALYYAAFNDDLALVSALLEADANIDAQNNKGKTALMVASQNAFAEVARVLLIRGANPNLKDHRGWSALFYAAYNDRQLITRLLLGNSANHAMLDKQGNSAGVIAKFKGHNNIAKLLLETDFEVNSPQALSY